MIERMRMSLILFDYEVMFEAITETLQADRGNIMAYLYWAFYALAKEGNLELGREKYEKLYGLIQE
jgi:hypothetical protein